MAEGGLTVQRGTQHPSSRGDEAGAEIERELTMQIVKADEAAAEIVTDTTDIGGVEMTKSGLTGDIDQVHTTETDITGKDQDQGALTGQVMGEITRQRLRQAALEYSGKGTVGEAKYANLQSRA